MFVKVYINREWLLKQDFSEEYAVLFPKQLNQMGLFLFRVFLGSQIMATYVSLILGCNVNLQFFLSKILFIATVCAAAGVVFGKFMFRKFGNQLKSIALKTQSEIVIDFNFNTLKRLLNPRLEIASSALIFYFNFTYLGNNPVLYLYTILPWIIVLILRRIKYQVRATIIFTYRMLAGCMILVQIFKGCLLIAAVLKSGGFAAFGSIGQGLFGILFLALSAAVILGFINYPEFKKAFT